jgi:hypothetical protein
MRILYETLQAAMDEKFFARCVWQEGDLEALDGIEKLDRDQRYTLINRVRSTLEDIMTSTGWEVLQTALDEYLRDLKLEDETQV